MEDIILKVPKFVFFWVDIIHHTGPSRDSPPPTTTICIKIEKKKF